MRRDPYKTIEAQDLMKDDRIVLTFMGGEEIIDITKVRKRRSGTVRWWGYNTVVGDMDEVIPLDQEVRLWVG